MGKELSKRYVLKLSDKDAVIKLPGVEDENANKIKTRESEIALLTSLFGVAANSQKEMVKCYECIEIIGRLENLDDSECEITLTKEDLDYIKSGFEATAGKRPGLWNYLGSIIKQLANPQELES